MKLHANARLDAGGPAAPVPARARGGARSRRGGGRGRRRERADRPQVAGPLPRRGRGRALRTAPAGRGARRERHARERRRRGDRPAPGAHDGRGDRRSVWRWRPRTVSRSPVARVGPRASCRALDPAEPANRFETPVARASWCTSTSRSSGASRPAPGTGSHGDRATDAAATESAGWERVHVGDRRRQPPGLRRGARRRAQAAPGCAFLERALTWFCRPRASRVERDPHRQRLGLPLAPAPADLRARLASATAAPGPTGRAPTARPSASSSTLARGLGLRGDLRLLGRAHRGALPLMAAFLQSPATPRRPQSPDAGRQAGVAPGGQRQGPRARPARPPPA